jgi:hypothetical protein
VYQVRAVAEHANTGRLLNLEKSAIYPADCSLRDREATVLERFRLKEAFRKTTGSMCEMLSQPGQYERLICFPGAKGLEDVWGEACIGYALLEMGSSRVNHMKLRKDGNRPSGVACTLAEPTEELDSPEGVQVCLTGNAS